jgi:signal transduction histidine kinase
VIRVQVVSEDLAVLALCREIAEEVESQWIFQLASDGIAPDRDADLCFWDYTSEGKLPDASRWGRRMFVFVPLRELETFRERYPDAEAGIVLKPITRAVLRALVAQVRAGDTAARRGPDSSVRQDRDELLQCLLEANLHLQRYEVERTNFLGRVLHDFHSPLTAFSGYCGLLLEGTVGELNEQQKMVVHRMQRSVRRLSRMSRSMYNLSIGRNVEVKPNLAEGDIGDCIEQSFYEMQPIAHEKQLDLQVDLEPPTGPLFFEAGQIEQVLINLLENACRFTPRFGAIAVRGYPCFWERREANVICVADQERRSSNAVASNAYRIDIRDSGPGIGLDHLASVFEEYVSYFGGKDRSGGGLGLAICRMILSQHRGRIWAENTSSGTVFSFVLPCNRGPAPASASLGSIQETPVELTGVGL